MTKKETASIALWLGIALLSVIIIIIWGHPLASADTQRQASSVLSYNKALTSSTIASELGLPAAAIVSFTEDASGCTVTLNSVLRTDTDATYDSQGNLIASRQRLVTSLEDWQQSRLDQLMQARGCYRLTR